MYLCPECFLVGYCRKLNTQITSEAELAKAAFVADLKAYAHACQVSCDRWREHLLALYRDYPGEILDENGEPVWLNTSVFDGEMIRYWFRDFCQPAAAGVTPRIRREAKPRAIVMATILRAHDPAGTRLWGVRAANDAQPPAIRPGSPDGGHCAVLATYEVPAALRLGHRGNRN